MLARIDERLVAFDAKFDTFRMDTRDHLFAQDEKIARLPQWRHVATGLGTIGVAGIGAVARLFLHK